jgi:hypothetical protein
MRVQMWSDLKGAYAQEADRLRLRQIAERATSIALDAGRD